MTQSTMTKYDFTDVISYYNEQLAKASEVYISEGNQGGKVRGINGKLYETIATLKFIPRHELDYKDPFKDPFQSS